MLEAGDDVPHALDELQRLGALRGVDHFAIHVQRVVHGHHLAVVDFCFFSHVLSNLGLERRRRAILYSLPLTKDWGHSNIPRCAPAEVAQW